jgi:hypothetical protein
MLVRQVSVNAKTGEQTESWVDIPGIEDPTAALVRTQAEAAAAQTAATNENTITSRVDAALNANNAFLALASPTQAQTLAQVKTLTKECTGLIRLLRKKLDSAAGT